jgi:SAM-dependent methyltransferase
MIGLATGAWAQVVANIPGVEHMTVVEINPGYLTLISKYPQVKSLLTNPKVDIVVDDGRRWLNRHPDDRFDVMVMNTTWHWRAHATNLLSQEYFELARSRLAPGGILLFNTTSSDDVKRTAMTVFPYGYRIWNCLVVSDSPFTFDRDRYRKMLVEMKIDGEHIIDPTDEALLDKSVAYADTLNWTPSEEGPESRDSVLLRSCYQSEKDTGKCLIASRVITDDNMVPEWRKVIRFQDPP